MKEGEYLSAGYHNMTSHEPPAGPERAAYLAGQWCRKHRIAPYTYKHSGNTIYTININNMYKLQFHAGRDIPRVTCTL
jgi:hypothetical protein